jgi:hypothetical protein
VAYILLHSNECFILIPKQVMSLTPKKTSQISPLELNGTSAAFPLTGKMGMRPAGMLKPLYATKDSF